MVAAAAAPAADAHAQVYLRALALSFPYPNLGFAEAGVVERPSVAGSGW